MSLFSDPHPGNKVYLPTLFSESLLLLLHLYHDTVIVFFIKTINFDADTSSDSTTTDTVNPEIFA